MSMSALGKPFKAIKRFSQNLYIIAHTTYTLRNRPLDLRGDHRVQLQVLEHGRHSPSLLLQSFSAHHIIASIVSLIHRHFPFLEYIGYYYFLEVKKQNKYFKSSSPSYSAFETKFLENTIWCNAPVIFQ